MKKMIPPTFKEFHQKLLARKAVLVRHGMMDVLFLKRRTPILDKFLEEDEVL
jgi:hypothetical protein